MIIDVRDDAPGFLGMNQPPDISLAAELLPLAAGAGGLVELVDPAPSVAQRFYRVRRW